jgi:hypothetical protein
MAESPRTSGPQPWSSSGRGATVEEVARSVLGDLNSDAGILRAIRWVIERYQELTTRTRLRQLRRVVQVHVPAPLQGVGVTLTVGSPTVVVTTSPSPVTQAHVGWWFRASAVWYEIAAVHATSFTLTVPFEDTTAGATLPATGTILKRTLALPPGIRSVEAVLFPRLRRTLRLVSLFELNQAWPSRPQVGVGPRLVAEVGLDAAGNRLLEVYPYSQQAETYEVVVTPAAEVLGPTDALPTAIEPMLLKQGVLIDAYRYEMAKALQARDLQGASLWGAELRRQESTWEQAIAHLIEQDRATADMTLLLRPGGTVPSDDPLVATARDDVWLRWPT